MDIAQLILFALDRFTTALPSSLASITDHRSPTPLPTPLGIHRLYTIPSYRSLGIAEALLDVACLHTIYACPARPEKGQVAFSQPTQSGARMMRRWGKGGVRVFDESQL